MMPDGPRLPQLSVIVKLASGEDGPTAAEGKVFQLSGHFCHGLLAIVGGTILDELQIVDHHDVCLL
jgi:hypothetical protein